MAEIPPTSELIYLTDNPTDLEIRQGIQKWLELLSNENYEQAIKAIAFPYETRVESFRKRIETFFGDQLESKPDKPSTNILDRIEIYRTEIPADCIAVTGFFIPLENGYGIWTTFLIKLNNNSAYFEFEIFHA